MSFTSVYIPIICVCLFVILTTLIHISDLPICRYDYTHVNRMNTPLTAAIGAISMIILGQLRRYLLYSNTDKYSNINMSILTVNLITVISYIISLIDQNICIDNWGAVTYAANWCSWIITVPLLMYTVLVPEFGRAPSSDDIKAIMSIFLTIATGFSMQFHGIDIYGTIILFVVGLISFLFALYFVYFSIKVSMEKCDKNMTAGHKAFNDEVFRLYLLRDLFVVVIVTMTLSFVVYVLAANSALTPTTALVSYLVIDVVGKGLMAFTVIDAHVPILHAVSEEQEIHFKANSHLRSLVRYMLYETRIPLNALAMSLDYVVSEPSLRTDRSEEDVAASKREAFETMVVATTYLEKALNDYLTMQQIEEGNLLLNHHEVVMRDVWTDVVGQLSSIISARNVELKLSPLAVFPEIVLADRCYLTRALVNLLNSAITCSKAGSKISIHVSSEVGSCKGGPSSEETTGIFITFSTEHPCKTLDELRCCFEPYSTLLIGDIFGDCFSGLSPVIAKEIIALHNGTVDLSTSSNGCLIFNINLNLRRVDDREILRRPLKKNRFRAIQVHAHEKDVVYSRLSKPQQDGNSNRCNSNRSTHTDVVLTNESSELSWSLRHQAAHADVTPLSCIKEGCTLSGVAYDKMLNSLLVLYY